MQMEQVLAVAGGALAVVLWSKHQAAQAQSAAVPANQPTNWLPWIAVGVIGLLAYRQQQMPVSPKTPSTGVLAGVFSTNDDRDAARADALKFAKLCNSVADAIETDLTLTTPLFKTGTQLDDLRRRARIYEFRGGSLQSKYPQLPTKADSYLTAQLGTSGGPADEAQKKKWVVAMRGLGAAAAEEAK